MGENEKMYFIRNITAIENKHETESLEYEIIADANITADLDYGPYYFCMWDFAEEKSIVFRNGDKRKLCLRITFGLFGSDWNSASESGYSHGGGIADELVALSSLFLRRRLKLGPIVRRNDRPMYLPKSTGWIDKQVVEGHSSLRDLSDWLKLVEGLDTKYHLKFILSARLYHRALLLVEEEPDFAYLNLVSAIEVLCGDTDIGKVTLQDLNTKLSGLVRSIDDESLKIEVEAEILKNNRFIKRKFVKFILDNLDENFWDEGERPKIGKIESTDLELLLGRIYDQRSKTLHEGDPFSPSVCHPPILGEEIDISLGEFQGDRIWKLKKFIPSVQFFERLVNHVLKTFLKRNQVG